MWALACNYLAVLLAVTIYFETEYDVLNVFDSNYVEYVF